MCFGNSIGVIATDALFAAICLWVCSGNRKPAFLNMILGFWYKKRFATTMIEAIC